VDVAFSYNVVFDLYLSTFLVCTCKIYIFVAKNDLEL